MRLMTFIIVSAATLAACSKSPFTAVVDATEAAGQRIMQPLLHKDASIQAKRMTELLSHKPECEVFKERMTEAGQGSPYEGATQWKLVHAQQDACAAGCCK